VQIPITAIEFVVKGLIFIINNAGETYTIPFVYHFSAQLEHI
jgi:hypothetical protein